MSSSENQSSPSPSLPQGIGATMSKRKIKVFSLSDKLKIVNEFEGGKKRSEILSEFGLPESTFYKIIKERDSIKAQCCEGHGDTKRNRVTEFPVIEKCLAEWIKQALDNNIPIDGPLLKEKAKEFATRLGIHNFAASNGWLGGFKKRHDIAIKKGSGESKSLERGVCNQWSGDLPSLLTGVLTLGYEPDEIYKTDLTGLFYKCLPEETFSFKGEVCHGGSLSEERLTILLCSNLTGTDKLPLLIVGKSKRPRCFKGVKTLPVDYDSSAKAWMTREIFKGWLKKVDYKMRNEGRKIVLLIEYCTAHTELPAQLTNVNVIFLPANSIIKLEQRDQGIIHIFKRFYRKEIIHHILWCLDKKISPEISVLLALKFARIAWYSVSDVTVRNCFKKAGFCIGGMGAHAFMLEENNIEVVPSSDEWAKIESQSISMPKQTFDDFVGVDEDVLVSGEYTDDDIVVDCVNMLTDRVSSEDEDDRANVSLDTDKKVIPTKQEALDALETIHKFFEFSNTDPSIFDKIYDIENHIKNARSES